MHRHAGGFADRHQSGNRRVWIAIFGCNDFRAIVGRDAAHVVVHGRENRDRPFGDVDPGKDARAFGDAGQPLVDDCWVKVVEVQVDVVLLRSDPASLPDLDRHGAAHHVTAR